MRNNSLTPAFVALMLFFAAALPARTVNATPPLTDECNLPAPGNLAATASGATWVSLGWSAVESAVGYRVRAYRTSDGEQVADIQSAQAAATVSNLDPGVTYRFTVATVCQNQATGKDVVATSQGTIVIDIVLNNTPPDGPQQLLQPDNNGCVTVAWGGSPINILLDVIGANDVNRFNLEIADGGHVVIRKVANLSAAQNLQAVSQNFTPAPVQNIQYANIVTQSTGGVVSTINISRNGSLFTICVPPATGYQFQFWQVLPSFSEPGDGDRSSAGGHQTPAAMQAVLLQNPCTATIRLSVSMPEPGYLHVRVFDADGREVLEHRQQADLESTLDLPAEGLKAGWYLVRVETDHAVRTLRALKL